MKLLIHLSFDSDNDQLFRFCKLFLCLIHTGLLHFHPPAISNHPPPALPRFLYSRVDSPLFFDCHVFVLIIMGEEYTHIIEYVQSSEDDFVEWILLFLPSTFSWVLGPSALTAGAFFCWAILLALFWFVITDMGGRRHVYKLNTSDGCQEVGGQMESGGRGRHVEVRCHWLYRSSSSWLCSNQTSLSPCRQQVFSKWGASQ